MRGTACIVIKGKKECVNIKECSERWRERERERKTCQYGWDRRKGIRDNVWTWNNKGEEKEVERLCVMRERERERESRI